MRPPRKLLGCVLAVLLLSGCAAFDTAAAVVDGSRIEEEPFARTLEYFAADPQFAAQFPGEEAREGKRSLARQLLTFLIHQVVIEEHARARSLGADEAAVERRLQEQIQALGGEQAFDRQLAAAGASRGDVEDLIRKQVLRENVARLVVTEQVPEEQLRQQYEERAIEFTQVRVSHILVADEALAQDLAQRVTPKNFAELAREHSEDPGSAEQGGDLGMRPAGEFVEPFARATVGSSVGDIVGPVRTEFGYHIVWVRERTAPAFEEVRDQLLAEVGQEFFTNWLLQRLRDAQVLVNPRYGVFDRESGEVVERTATTPLPDEQPDVQVQP
ncbi:MAG TPA: peptidylprolyl isomerase [Actinomycetota bacterium]|nr:peptidylprolyl isomerase [Actinomycetota bacterium]